MSLFIVGSLRKQTILLHGVIFDRGRMECRSRACLLSSGLP